MELNVPGWGTPTHPVIGGTANLAPQPAVNHTEQSPQQSGPETDISMEDFCRRLSQLEELDRDREQNNQRRHDEMVGLLTDNKKGWANVTNMMEHFQSQREAEAWTAQQRHEQLCAMLDDHGNALMEIDVKTGTDQILGLLKNHGNALAEINTRMEQAERKHQKQRKQERRQRQAHERNKERRHVEMVGLMSQGMQMAAQNMDWGSSARTSHGPHAQGPSTGAAHPPPVPVVNNPRGSKGRRRKRPTTGSWITAAQALSGGSNPAFSRAPGKTFSVPARQ
ncbi:hypothetical protein DFP73DRAFT_569966 [Morchella snyderi]|nr:hypothetical protein DFP73DRAFT_569966 [Morchella snyderi]